MDSLYHRTPRSACSLLAERKTYTFNGRYVGSYLEVPSDASLPTGLYPLVDAERKCEGTHRHACSHENRFPTILSQFWIHDKQIIYFPPDQETQMRAFFHSQDREPVETLECHPDGNQSYSSYHAMLDAKCTIEQLYREFCRHLKQSDRLSPPDLYRLLWEIYFLEYPDLLRVAAEYDGFRDRGPFGENCIYRPQNVYQDRLQSSASLAIAHAVWQYQHYVLWDIPPALQIIARRYWFETHSEPFPSNQIRQWVLQAGDVIVLVPDGEVEYH